MSRLSRFWKKLDFTRLNKESKLLFIYLFTNPDINHVGVLYPNLDVVKTELGFTMDELREATKELRDGGFLYVIGHKDSIYFILPHYFDQIPKSQSSFEKISKTLKLLPEPVVKRLNELGINASVKVKEFVKPTAKEVSDYALSIGHNIDGQTFVDFYDNQSLSHGQTNIWVDGRGKQVRDWKAKLKRVWAKDENKIKVLDGCPKGFENFNIELNGKIFYPDGWKDGVPFSKNITMDLMFKKKFKDL